MTTENTSEQALASVTPQVDASEVGLFEFKANFKKDQTVTSKDGVVMSLEAAYELMLDSGKHYRTGVDLDAKEMAMVRSDSLKLLMQKTSNLLKVEFTISNAEARQAALVTSTATKLKALKDAKAARAGSTPEALPVAPANPATQNPEVELIDPPEAELKSEDVKVRTAAQLKLAQNQAERDARAAAAGAATTR